jgi:hypothetical protein
MLGENESIINVVLPVCTTYHFVFSINYIPIHCSLEANQEQPTWQTENTPSTFKSGQLLVFTPRNFHYDDDCNIVYGLPELINRSTVNVASVVTYVI